MSKISWWGENVSIEDPWLSWKVQPLLISLLVILAISCSTRFYTFPLFPTKVLNRILLNDNLWHISTLPNKWTILSLTMIAFDTWSEKVFHIWRIDFTHFKDPSLVEDLLLDMCKLIIEEDKIWHIIHWGWTHFQRMVKKLLSPMVFAMEWAIFEDLLSGKQVLSCDHQNVAGWTWSSTLPWHSQVSCE